MSGFQPIRAPEPDSRATPLASFSSGIGAQFALTPTLKADAYKIRHAGYLSHGFITPRPDQHFVDDYDARQNVLTAIVYKNDAPAGTVRLCLFDPSGSSAGADTIPAMEIFKDDIMRTMSEQTAQDGAPRRRAAEITRMAQHPDYAHDKSVLFGLLRIIGYLILYYDADVLFNACRPHHAPAYRRFGFQKIQEPRQYPNLTYKACLMAYFRRDYKYAQETLSPFSDVSKDDSVYDRLVAGEKVDLDLGMSRQPDLFSPTGRLLQRQRRVALDAVP